MKLIEELGLETVKELHKLASRARVWTKKDLEDIERDLESKVASIQKTETE